MAGDGNGPAMSIVLALPKGRILDEAGPLLSRAGVEPAPDYADESSRRLRFPTNHAGLDVIRVRSFDIATFVAFGGAQIGLCGGDVLMEFDYPEVYAPLDLGIGHCRISVAEPKDDAGQTDLNALSRIRVASKYPNVTKKHFAARGVQAEIVALNGSMELAPGLGLSRFIVDLVQTGSTLKANGLVETDIIAHVSTRLIVNRVALKTRPDEISGWIENFRRALGP
jgi:ATP phosphoribosyltransferase